MGIFFKKMSKKETENWEKGCVLGFYVFLIVLFINQIYYYFYESYLFPTSAILWIGLVSSFTWSSILNIKCKRKEC
ncbi:hypothetical protein BKP45_10315 [Anaerobacillus alkalidiazotrophicus]|uniref:Uncharacterized protein n=1 Tax=Anaerobacillus alkalidiazotrophicus TaxID=472963 RepID=A0A1S2M6B6_9BACI|nr:hypothetical protein BKP45_10315 [Anaerobacillus alkalidiazotrophicus]